MGFEQGVGLAIGICIGNILTYRFIKKDSWKGAIIQGVLAAIIVMILVWLGRFLNR